MLAGIIVARVFIAVGVAWPNHLAVAVSLWRVICDHRESSSLWQASARTLVVLDVYMWRGQSVVRNTRTACYNIPIKTYAYLQSVYHPTTSVHPDYFSSFVGRCE